mmetsp:Transcript_122726/g.392217  ORF Transcript_122726/g.392217 Transcript_122726/m.392217 type:complete len:233 (-) Transcript_122726:274-972(-)
MTAVAITNTTVDSDLLRTHVSAGSRQGRWELNRNLHPRLQTESGRSPAAAVLWVDGRHVVAASWQWEPSVRSPPDLLQAASATGQRASGSRASTSPISSWAMHASHSSRAETATKMCCLRPTAGTRWCSPWDWGTSRPARPDAAAAVWATTRSCPMNVAGPPLDEGASSSGKGHFQSCWPRCHQPGAAAEAATSPSEGEPESAVPPLSPWPPALRPTQGCGHAERPSGCASA